jgi:uncharacterized protein YebE (UPF0316 family)
MEIIDVLVKFAEENGIEKSKAYEFMKKIKRAGTVKELLEMPNDLRKHYGDTSHIHSERELAELIEDVIEPNRYETVTLLEIISYLEAKEVTEEQREAIGQSLVRLKFGSMVYDW